MTGKVFILLAAALASLASSWHRPAGASMQNPPSAQTILAQMENAYAQIKDYRAEMEHRIVSADGSTETRRFIYTFKKPDHIRMDFVKPHGGMVLVYPDATGKVVVKPAGWLGFMKMRFSVDNSLITGKNGQRIDQTDIGLLIRNMRRSLTEERQESMEITDQENQWRIQVLARDHFKPEELTRYTFLVDKNLRLPVAVEERTPDGRLRRSIVFNHLRVNLGVEEGFFRLD